ncbi:hypothetical protein MSG28_012710 [Choristoneura fumiferana]|uniref:Uncharacterized protein n=1 Tax=Choristoneura fumiferana TaxID=7141 RepID=A0ACC0JHT0_CHOFU|nr:hypothetical protein MSG28_012710 [Choristoneura fumiferana]
MPKTPRKNLDSKIQELEKRLEKYKNRVMAAPPQPQPQCFRAQTPELEIIETDPEAPELEADPETMDSEPINGDENDSEGLDPEMLLALGEPTSGERLYGEKPRPNPNSPPKTAYDFTVKDINGKEVRLEKYKGYVSIIVNVASQCGYTDNHYKQLSELYEKYASRGLRILAFPCNQFGGQEPGSPRDILAFAKNRSVKFDLFEKVEVNGDNAHPLWKFLKEALGESAISPETAQAMCRSTSTIFSIVVDSINGEVILFSTAKTTPSEVQIPMAVEPSLMASMAYSTWNSLPSGLKVFTPRSYSDRIYSSKGCRG